jgi:hypothetical protein
MKYTKITLENLFSDYVLLFETNQDSFKSYLSAYSLKYYHLRNKSGNNIYRYTVCHGFTNETKEYTLSGMINAIKSAIDTSTPLLKLGV